MKNGGKSVKPENMFTAWYESMSGLVKKHRKTMGGLKYCCSTQAILLKNRKAYIPLPNNLSINGCRMRSPPKGANGNGGKGR